MSDRFAHVPFFSVHAGPVHRRSSRNGVIRMTAKTHSDERLEPLAYSISEACKVSSIGRTYLYQLINEGRIEIRKIGKRTLIPAASLHSLIAGER